MHVGVTAPCACPEDHLKLVVPGLTFSRTPLPAVYHLCIPPQPPPQSGIHTLAEAVWHYFSGNGATAPVSSSVQREIENVPEVLTTVRGLMAGMADRGKFDKQVQLSVDMTSTVFYIGDTNIYYYVDECEGGWCPTRFTWGPDSFKDPFDVPGLEIGTPYDFATHHWTRRFRDPNAPREVDSHHD